ncbi:hypothetical protein VNO77_33761 [Canavalia gladiata]|uniref:Uncharacterized protein n=1 Tax=Canavalia gladiata TaxID=3824 RepID=A0AAN9KDY2_CANGL
MVPGNCKFIALSTGCHLSESSALSANELKKGDHRLNALDAYDQSQRVVVEGFDIALKQISNMQSRRSLSTFTHPTSFIAWTEFWQVILDPKRSWEIRRITKG